MGWLMIFSLSMAVYFLAKIGRFLEWLITGEGEDIVYSDLPDYQIIDVLVALNENRGRVYENDIFRFNGFRL